MRFPGYGEEERNVDLPRSRIRTPRAEQSRRVSSETDHEIGFDVDAEPAMRIEASTRSGCAFFLMRISGEPDSGA